MEHFQRSPTKKCTKFVLFRYEKKRKMKPIDMLIVRGQQDFELHDQLSPIEIKITDDNFLNRLKNIKEQRINLEL